MRWRSPAPTATACGSRAPRAAIEDDHASPAFWTPVSETRWLEGGRGAFPHLALDRSKPGLIAVNAAGRRFVDEAVSYHDFVLGMHRSHADRADHSGLAHLRPRRSSANTASAASHPGAAAAAGRSRTAI